MNVGSGARPPSVARVASCGVVAAVVLVVVGCTRQGDVDGGPEAAADTIEGAVRQVGNTPFQRTIVNGEEGSATIVGDYEDELTRATGARVRVWGAYTDGSGGGRELEATGYRILSVDGAEPAVGVLEHSDGRGYYLDTEEDADVSLVGVPSRLGARVGAKVWVVVGDRGNVQRYGVLREP